jgi:hypothetical protein
VNNGLSYEISNSDWLSRHMIVDLREELLHDAHATGMTWLSANTFKDIAREASNYNVSYG